MDYAGLIKKQTDYFHSGVTKPIPFRIEQLKKLKAVLKLNESKLYEAIYADFKKSEFDTYATELGLIYREIDDAIRNLPAWARTRRVNTNLINIPGRSYIIPEPLGVCLVIGAWNYPYQISILPAVSAMAAGNTMIIKPSEIPAGTSAIIAKVINENFPSEYLVVVEGGISETSELLNEKFDKIFFTGSTPVGKIVYAAAAKHLTPVTLELGGKSPAIVTKNCNLKDSAKRIIWSKYLNAGQSCIAPDYICVDKEVEQELLSHFVDYIKKSEYSFDHQNYTQIINERNFHRLTGLLDKNKIYYGGETDLQKRYIAPTIVTDVTFDDPIMQDEIFGPILPVLSYSNLNEVMETIKAKPKPLAFYLFTNDHALKRKLLYEMSFGGGAVNDSVMHITNANLPFGGVGNSGMGQYHGRAGFNAFSHHKSILEKAFWFELKLKYSPYTKQKLSWIKWLMRI